CFDALATVQMAGPNPHRGALVITGSEEGQATDVVEMRMAIEEIELNRAAGGHQIVAQQAKPRAAVEHHQAIAPPDPAARGITAVADRIGAGAGNAAAHAPKPYRIIRMDQRPILALLHLLGRIYRRQSVKTPAGSDRFSGISKTFL